jgi:hypothetical protein
MTTDRAASSHRPPALDLTATELRLGLAAVLGFAYSLCWLAIARPGEEASRHVPSSAEAPQLATSSRTPAPSASLAPRPAARGSAAAPRALTPQPIAASRPVRAGRVRTRSS